MAGAGAGEIGAVLAAHMGDPASGFSVGALGALAEFHRAAGEALTLDDRDRLRVATGRGALATGALAGVAPVAYEYPAADGESWRHGVVFCLPAVRARGARRRPEPATRHFSTATRGASCLPRIFPKKISWTRSPT